MFFRKSVDSLLSKFDKLETELQEVGQQLLQDAAEQEARADALLDSALQARTEADRAFRVSHRVAGLTL